MDDVAVLIATPQTGYQAIAQYINDIYNTTGVHIKKVEVYAPSLDASTHEACAHRIAATTTCGVEFVIGSRSTPSTSSGEDHLHRGVEFMGAPIGDLGFEEDY